MCPELILTICMVMLSAIFSKVCFTLTVSFASPKLTTTRYESSSSSVLEIILYYLTNPSFCAYFIINCLGEVQVTGSEVSTSVVKWSEV